MKPSHYYKRLLFSFFGLLVTGAVYFVSGWGRVFSVMGEGTLTFSITYLVIVFIALLMSFEYLRRVQLWRAVIRGVTAGYMAGFVAYFASVFLTPYWAERTFHMVGLSSIFMIVWIPIVLLAWTWSTVGFLLVSGLSKRYE
jgi:hypothetical protein